MAIAKLKELPISERDRRYSVIRDEMKKRGLDCLIMFANGGHFSGPSHSSVFQREVYNVRHSGLDLSLPLACPVLDTGYSIRWNPVFSVLDSCFRGNDKP